MVLDLLIKNATIVDGTGSKAFVSDIGIQDGKIAMIRKDIDIDSIKTIDSTSKIVSPGFIDGHTHSDYTLFKDSCVLNKLAQGVTTELCGLCGISMYPLSEETISARKAQGYFFPDGFDDFGSYEQYLKAVGKLKLSHNLGFFAGHGAIRFAVMGASSKKASPSELEKMKELLEKALSQGAVGLSTGLKYAPGCYANDEEITELCKVVGKHNKVYESHIRYQGSRLVESVRETLEKAEIPGLTSIVSHHKALGRKNWGLVRESVPLIHRFKDRGLSVGHNVYPYVAACTSLSASLPPSVLAFSPSEIIKRLSDPLFAESVKEGIFNPSEEWDNDLLNSGYDNLMILNAKNTPLAQGLTIQQYADKINADPFKTFIDILVKNELKVNIMNFAISEDDMRYVLSDNLSMVGSDSNYKAGDIFSHPRAFGTFPRVLGHYVRELKLLTVEEAIRKMTGLPAETYHIKNKGLISEDFDADLVVFNPETIIDGADYINTMAANKGIDYVIVDGKVALKDNKLIADDAGKVLRF